MILTIMGGVNDLAKHMELIYDLNVFFTYLNFSWMKFFKQLKLIKETLVIIFASVFLVCIQTIHNMQFIIT